jgi:membrane protein YqaA with SNARE-associated domain
VGTALACALPVRALFSSVLSYFLTPAGLVVLGALDSSLIFFLPLGIDFALIVVTARKPELFWMYAIAATAGSLLGAAFTYWLGRKIGEKGLAQWVGEGRLHRVRDRVSKSAAPAIAALAIIPPPFPFTAFVLTSGALAFDVWRFFLTLAVVRVARFGIEAAVAARYGRRILVWMDSTVFEGIVGVLIVLAIVGTAVSAVAAFRSSRRRPAV